MQNPSNRSNKLHKVCFGSAMSKFWIFQVLSLLTALTRQKNSSRTRFALSKQKETLNARPQVAPKSCFFFITTFFNQFEKNGQLDRIGPRPDENFTVELARCTEFQQHWVPQSWKFEFVKLKLNFKIMQVSKLNFTPPPGPDGCYAVVSAPHSLSVNIWSDRKKWLKITAPCNSCSLFGTVLRTA